MSDDGVTIDPWADVRAALGVDLSLSDLPRIKYTAKGEVAAKQPLTIENVEAVLRKLGVSVRYDMLACRDELVLPEPAEGMLQALEGDNPSDWDGRVLGVVTRLLAEVDVEAAHAPLDHILRVLAQRGRYSPVERWLLGLGDEVKGTYDPGIDYVADLIDTVELEHPEDAAIWEAACRHWLRQAVAAALFWRKPQSMPLVLVFVGAQGIGKTRWVLNLVPQDHTKFVREGVTLDHSHKGDRVLQAAGVWIAELGEIDGLTRKAEVEGLKNFLSQREDVFRPAYGRVTIRRPRQTVYIGTANAYDILRDMTGSRRFAVVAAKGFRRHEIDMRCVWQQVVEEVLVEGLSFYLPDEVLAKMKAGNERYLDLNEPAARWQDALAHIPQAAVEAMVSARPADLVAYLSVDEVSDALGLREASRPLVRSQMRQALQASGCVFRADTEVTGGARLRNKWLVPHPRFWDVPGSGKTPAKLPAEWLAKGAWKT